MNKNTDKRTLYFAYGSNLNQAQMALRCPAAKPVGRYTLHGFALVFRRVADIVPGTRQQRVEGALWSITDDCIEALDLYEGVNENGNGLYRREYVDVGDGEDALTYVMNRDYFAEPPQHYAQTILQGFDDFDIPLNGSKAHTDLKRAARTIVPFHERARRPRRRSFSTEAH